jgi:hypothetical protein
MNRNLKDEASQGRSLPNSKDDLHDRDDLHETQLKSCMKAVSHPSREQCALLGLLLFLLSVISLLIFEKSLAYVGVFFILSFLIALESIIVFWAHKKIKSFQDTLLEIVELPPAEIKEWFERQELRIFHDKRLILPGFAMILIAHALGLDNNGISYQSAVLNILIYGYYYLSVFIVGIGLYIVIMTGLMVHQIGKLPLDITIIISKKIQSIGVIYSKFTICAACVYITWGVFHMLTPTQFSSFRMISWYVFFGLLLIFYFVLPQYGIHRMIIETKKQKVNTFSSKLRAVAEKAFANPVKENVSCLRSMFDIQRQLDEMSEWPFGSYEVVHISLIVVIPLVVVLLEILLGIVR